MTTIVDMINNNKTTSLFVKEDNIGLLWKIITNTPAFKSSIQTNGAEGEKKLRSYYIQHVREFVENNIYDTSSIVDFNKKFISYFIQRFQEPNANANTKNATDNMKEHVADFQKLNIDNKSNLGQNAITIEELKSERMNDFEDRYQKIQNDFDVYRKTELPEDIDFSDKNRDRPINENELQQHITNSNEERKEQETLFSKNMNPDTTQAMKWLNLKETPKALIPEPSVFNNSPQLVNKNDIVDEKEINKTEPSFVINQKSDGVNTPVMLVKNNSENKMTNSHLYNMVFHTRRRNEMLTRNVDELKTKLTSLEKKTAMDMQNMQKKNVMLQDKLSQLEKQINMINQCKKEHTEDNS